MKKGNLKYLVNSRMPSPVLAQERNTHTCSRLHSRSTQTDARAERASEQGTHVPQE